MNTATAPTREQIIDENFEAFQLVLPQILIAHHGKAALMRNRQLEEIFPTAVEAIREGKRRYPDRLFSVQTVEKPQTAELGWFSHFQSA